MFLTALGGGKGADPEMLDGSLLEPLEELKEEEVDDFKIYFNKKQILELQNVIESRKIFVLVAGNLLSELKLLRIESVKLR